MSDVPKTHPRYLSLSLRDTIGCRRGARHHLYPRLNRTRTWRGFRLPHRGGDTTLRDGGDSCRPRRCSAWQNTPVISVNGNVAALVPDGLVEIGTSPERSVRGQHFPHGNGTRTKNPRIPPEARRTRRAHADNRGATLLYRLQSGNSCIQTESLKRMSSVVPLEDGDRCEALRKMG